MKKSCDMEQKLDVDEEDQEPGEEQLFELIKQAGDEARARKREAMAQHFKKLKDMVAEVMSQQQNSILK
ncbi:MAG: hypothetical protein V1872_14375 [bacterium]